MNNETPIASKPTKFGPEEEAWLDGYIDELLVSSNLILWKPAFRSMSDTYLCRPSSPRYRRVSLSWYWYSLVRLFTGMMF